MERATDWYSRVGVACPIILQARGDGSRPISRKGERPLPETWYVPHGETDRLQDRNIANRDIRRSTQEGDL